MSEINGGINIKHLVKRIVATKDGEDLLLALETMYNASPSFVIGDSHLTAFNEGKRAVVLHLLSCLLPEESQDKE